MMKNIIVVGYILIHIKKIESCHWIYHSPITLLETMANLEGGVNNELILNPNFDFIQHLISSFIHLLHYHINQ